MPSTDEISFPKKELGQTKINDDMPFLLTMKNWVSRFRTGHLSTDDEERSGRPTQLTIPGNVDDIHSMILDHIKFHAKKIAETVAISREKVAHIINEISDMRKPVHLRAATLYFI